MAGSLENRGKLRELIDKFKFVELRKSALEREVNMSRIHAGECEHMDMEWYGVDRQGNVAVFCSGGVGN